MTENSSEVTARHSILVVDDDPAILKILSAVVDRAGHRIVTTASPTDAIHLARAQPFAAIISDHQMPGMTGAEFLHEVAKIQPNASRILITGLRSVDVVAKGVNNGEIYRFLTKPWVPAEMSAALESAVKRYELLEAKDGLEAMTRKLNEELATANRQLEQQVCDLQQQKKLLDESRLALKANFDRSLELCHRILATFNPLLGKQARAAARICDRLAETTYFTDEERHSLVVSAHLYDIGLTGLPPEYAQAIQGDLSRLPEEIQHLVANHTIYGQTLASFVDSLQGVGDTIRSHHERHDGKGYPDGLAGEMIPWCARCLAVVAYYVSCGLPHESAVESILAQSGMAFDPEAVRLFLKVADTTASPGLVRQVLLDDLSPGMRLATGIYSSTGILLIPEGRYLDDPTIAKIRNHSSLASLPQQLLVFC